MLKVLAAIALVLLFVPAASAAADGWWKEPRPVTVAESAKQIVSQPVAPLVSPLNSPVPTPELVIINDPPEALAPPPGWCDHYGYDEAKCKQQWELYLSTLPTP